MSEVGKKRCVVAYATREHQYLWTVDLPEGATIAEALEVARRFAAVTPTTPGAHGEVGEPAASDEGATPGAGPESEGIPWDTAPVGIFGEPRDRQDVPGDGDRIEIYRPLGSDPRQRRRERVRRDRRAKQG